MVGCPLFISLRSIAWGASLTRTGAEAQLPLAGTAPKARGYTEHTACSAAGRIPHMPDYRVPLHILILFCRRCSPLS